VHAGAAGILPHLLAAGALSASEQLAVVHLVRSIMAQTPPNMDMGGLVPKAPGSAGKDYPATSLGISKAFTNIMVALALNPGPLVKCANEFDRLEGQEVEVELGAEVSPSPLCAAVTAQLVPLFQPVIFAAVTDVVFGNTAGISAHLQEQIKCIRRRQPDW
jgi:hypothetical protein